MYWYPIRYFLLRACSTVPSHASKAILTFFISFSMASHQKVVPVSSSICSASSTLLGIRIPNLCIVFQYLLFTFDISLSRFLRVCLTHHENADSSSIPLCIAYSTTSIGLDAFISLREIQEHNLSFYLINSFQPLVVFLGILFPSQLKIKPSFLSIAVWSLAWSMISSIMLYCLPLASTL